MPKKLVIHSSFRYIDASGQRRRAFRGETINVSKKEADRGDSFGAFGTPSDLAPPALDEGVVDLSPGTATSTPVVPLVSQSTHLEASLRERLNIEPGAPVQDVMQALDEALTKAQTPAEPVTLPPVVAAEPGGTIPPPVPGTVIVNLPGDESEEEPRPGDQGEPAVEDEDDEGLDDAADDGTSDQAAPMARPALTATVGTWRKFAVTQGMTEGEAKAANKPDLIARYGKD